MIRLWIMLLPALLLADAASRCTVCHEMTVSADEWRGSSHRNVPCESCHGGTFQMQNVKRLASHLRGTVPDKIRPSFDDVSEIVQRCRNCHANEYAKWSTGPHGTSMKRIFTDAKHNAKRTPTDDCFRCHGMFFDSGMRDLPAAQPKVGNERAIPCLACHSVHQQGTPAASDSKGKRKATLAFHDRRSGEHMGVELLPVPAVKQGARLVRMSNDKRQALCYGCHSPLSTQQAWSGDDRTPMGVHEGISCLGCHSAHDGSAAASCSNCHPRMSNCKLDVETMDTSFRDARSRHNIHTVACADCHPKGVPRTALTLDRRSRDR